MKESEPRPKFPYHLDPLNKMEDDPLNQMEDDYFANNKLTAYYIFIHSLVFSLRGRAGRNQSPVM